MKAKPWLPCNSKYPVMVLPSSFATIFVSSEKLSSLYGKGGYHAPSLLRHVPIELFVSLALIWPVAGSMVPIHSPAITALRSVPAWRSDRNLAATVFFSIETSISIVPSKPSFLANGPE